MSEIQGLRQGLRDCSQSFRPATLLIAAAFGLLSTNVSAADLPRKAPAYVPPPAPVYNWTGCYLGGNVGGAVPQNHRHCSQISLQQRLQDMLNDGVRPKGEEGFEAPHTARLPGRQYDTYHAHGTT